MEKREECVLCGCSARKRSTDLKLTIGSWATTLKYPGLLLFGGRGAVWTGGSFSLWLDVRPQENGFPPTHRSVPP
jgi:hypothetical protein